eukprot:gnl/TRDRNA2_/TRDRNA2_201269_c0_seq1.p1 gnl/TRDRNA2_/TRDRNA2_201269_c0~~gnl/TRDRNA2_/TRDRNA2_201269_c0_seq1.p1  ORF type:complete len:546 (+),score=55.98 gnl/TRDRNA2_/TRDRNA2_201269_c0_seq1:99-1736(+)
MHNLAVVTFLVCAARDHGAYLKASAVLVGRAAPVSSRRQPNLDWTTIAKSFGRSYPPPPGPEATAEGNAQIVREEAATSAFAAETRPWSIERIGNRTSIQSSPTKGRCLFVNDHCKPGEVIFVEKPMFAMVPSLAPTLWEALVCLFKDRPQIPGRTHHVYFAALMSLFHLDQPTLQVMLDKSIFDEDEDSWMDVAAILSQLSEELKEHQKEAIDPKTFQKLALAWKYNSFAHKYDDNGLVMYNRLSMCAHSCDPSCAQSRGYDANVCVLRARTALNKNDELTVSYLEEKDLLKATPTRQLLLQPWQFTCACERCSLQVDLGRGFRCPTCRVGVCYTAAGDRLEPCDSCKACPTEEQTTALIGLESEYLDKAAQFLEAEVVQVPEVERVYREAIDIFARHWVLYIMDDLLASTFVERGVLDSMEHLRRCVEFHEHYYCRPTCRLAWHYDDLGDALRAAFPHRNWQHVEAYQRAYRMHRNLCGEHHENAVMTYGKLQDVASSGDGRSAPARGAAGSRPNPARRALPHRTGHSIARPMVTSPFLRTFR